MLNLKRQPKALIGPTDPQIYSRKFPACPASRPLCFLPP
jgi:hypothetical protein